MPCSVTSGALLGVDHMKTKLPIASIIFWQAGLDPKPRFIQKFGPTRHRGVLTQPGLKRMLVLKNKSFVCSFIAELSIPEDSAYASERD